MTKKVNIDHLEGKMAGLIGDKTGSNDLTDELKVEFNGGLLTLKPNSDRPHASVYRIISDLSKDDLLALRLWEYLGKGAYSRDYKRNLEVKEPWLGKMEGCFPVFRHTIKDDEEYIDSIDICCDYWLQYPDFNLNMIK
jgi:hypothetical protein